MKRFAGEDGQRAISERSELVTNPSPKRGCFWGHLGVSKNQKSKGAKGLKGVSPQNGHLRAQQFESPCANHFFQQGNKTRHRSETKPRFLDLRKIRARSSNASSASTNRAGKSGPGSCHCREHCPRAPRPATVPFSGWSCRWSRRRFRAGSPLNRLRLQ